MKEGIPFGQKCAKGECHRILDESLEGDADAVPNSDSMYAFAGINPRAAEAELYHSCYFCRCTECRKQRSPSVEYIGCPNRTQTGLWRKGACHRSFGAVQRAQKYREETAAFGKRIEVGNLLATAADPARVAPGNRPYWLLRVRTKAFKTLGIKAKRGEPGSGIRKGTLVIKAEWYDSTSSANSRRHSYKLLPGVVYVPVSSIIQELGLDFMFGGSLSGDSCLSDEDHARLMAHNFANYR